MSICKSCGSDVIWRRIDGRWYCYNEDGSEHWDRCSAIRWEQTKATGVFFSKNGDSGYRNSVHGTKMSRQSSGFIRGKDYREDCCDCGLPAWEICSQNCSHGL